MERTFIPPAKPVIGKEERDAVDAVMASGMVVQSPFFCFSSISRIGAVHHIS